MNNPSNVIESYTTPRFKYTLESKGKTFVTTIEEFERTTRSGLVIKASTIKRQHRTMQSAMNSKLRPSQEMIDLIEAGEL